MLTEFFAELRNWFCKEKYFGKFSIVNGELQSEYQKGNNTLSFNLLPKQYFRIEGSILNNGVYIYPTTNLQDEVFEGAVWSMAVPHDVIDFLNDVQEWVKEHGQPTSEAMSPFSTESLSGVYSYAKGSTTASSGVGTGNSWVDVFGARLVLWRKV